MTLEPNFASFLSIPGRGFTNVGMENLISLQIFISFHNFILDLNFHFGRTLFNKFMWDLGFSLQSSPQPLGKYQRRKTENGHKKAGNHKMLTREKPSKQKFIFYTCLDALKDISFVQQKSSDPQKCSKGSQYRDKYSIKIRIKQTSAAKSRGCTSISRGQKYFWDKIKDTA